MSYDLVRRAHDANYEALVVTVDAPVGSNREYNLRNGFTIPFKFNARNISDVANHPRWFYSVLLRYMMTTGMPRYENYPQELRRSVTAKPMGRSMPKAESLTWGDLRELRRLWPRKLLIKGVLRPEDALQAVECGVDGVIVSNHGGRSLDYSVAPLDALPGVVERVKGRVPVLLDSGVRRGSDVVKALALGAHSVLVGRATLYGLAAYGQQGAARVLSLLHEEIERVQGLIGCPAIESIGLDCLYSAEGRSSSGGAALLNRA